MARVRINQMSNEDRYEIIGDFYDIVTSLNTKNGVIGFFMGLLTPGEALMFARRIQIAIMLLEEKSYDDIRKELGVGFATITTVNHWLFGENEQFKNHIQAHIKRKNGKKEQKRSKKYYENMLEKYPQHRILKDLFGL
jgi:uncharacterized protein YerC